MDKIYDPLRRKYVALTPEERVRQFFISYLIGQRGYPAGRMANEVALSLNGTRRRCDTVVYDRAAQPAMIIEYKAPEVALSQKVIDQVARYNMVLRTRWLTVTNGHKVHCCRIDLDTGEYIFVDDLPEYAELE